MITIPSAQTELDIAPKIGRDYKYKIEDRPGKMLWLTPSVLVIDPVYQREVKPSRVEELAKHWSWMACGVLKIALRDGINYIYDGNHRKLAAEKRRIDLLPCVVFRSSGVRQEAKAFLDTNTLRKPIGVHDQFKARGIIDDVMVQAIQELAQLAGRRIEPYANPQTIDCIGKIEQCLRHDADALRAVWPLLTELCLGKPFHSMLVTALFQVERRLEAGRSLTEKLPRQRLAAAGYDALLQTINRAKLEQGTSSSKAATGAILKLANYRLINRLELVEE